MTDGVNDPGIGAAGKESVPEWNGAAARSANEEARSAQMPVTIS